MARRTPGPWRGQRCCRAVCCTRQAPAPASPPAQARHAAPLHVAGAEPQQCPQCLPCPTRLALRHHTEPSHPSQHSSSRPAVLCMRSGVNRIMKRGIRNARRLYVSARGVSIARGRCAGAHSGATSPGNLAPVLHRPACYSFASRCRRARANSEDRALSSTEESARLHAVGWSRRRALLVAGLLTLVGINLRTVVLGVPPVLP